MALRNTPNFDINRAKNAIKNQKLVIRKGDGISHALLRAALGNEGDNKNWKELQKDFVKLQRKQRAELMKFAEELSKKGNIFHNPEKKIKKYKLKAGKFNVQSHITPEQNMKQHKETPKNNPKPGDIETQIPTPAPKRHVPEKVEDPKTIPTSETNIPEIKTNTPETEKIPETNIPEINLPTVAPVPANEKQVEEELIEALVPGQYSEIFIQDGIYHLIGTDKKETVLSAENFHRAIDTNIEKNNKEKVEIANLLYTWTKTLDIDTATEKNIEELLTAWESSQIDMRALEQGFYNNIKHINGINRLFVRNFLSQKDPEKRKLLMLQEIKQGNYPNLAVTLIANDYIQLTPENITEILQKLKNKEDISPISFGKNGKKSPKIDTKRYTDAIRNQVNEHQANFEKYWKESKDAYIQKIEEKRGKTLTQAEIQKAHEIFIQNNIANILPTILLYAQLDQEVNWKGDHTDKKLDLASSIIGTGTFNISSHTAKMLSEEVIITALSMAAGMATMGAGSVLIQSGIRGGRLSALSRVASSRYGFIAKEVGMGGAFAFGANAARSAITGENTMLNPRSYVESMGFFLAYSAISRAFGLAIPKGATLPNSGKNLKVVGEWVRKQNGMIQLAANTAITGTAINGTNAAIQLMIDGNIELHPSEIAEAYILGGLLASAPSIGKGVTGLAQKSGNVTRIIVGKTQNGIRVGLEKMKQGVRTKVETIKNSSTHKSNTATSIPNNHIPEVKETTNTSNNHIPETNNVKNIYTRATTTENPSINMKNTTYSQPKIETPVQKKVETPVQKNDGELQTIQKESKPIQKNDGELQTIQKEINDPFQTQYLLSNFLEGIQGSASNTLIARTKTSIVSIEKRMADAIKANYKLDDIKSKQVFQGIEQLKFFILEGKRRTFVLKNEINIAGASGKHKPIGAEKDIKNYEDTIAISENTLNSILEMIKKDTDGLAIQIRNNIKKYLDDINRYNP